MTEIHSPAVVNGLTRGVGEANEPAVEEEHIALAVEVAVHVVEDPFDGPPPDASDASAEASKLAEFDGVSAPGGTDVATPADTELRRKTATIPIASPTETRVVLEEPSPRLFNMVSAQ